MYRIGCAVAVIDDAPVRLRTLVLPVFAPMVLYGIGTGAAAPMYALRALDLGASAGAAGLIVALSGLGMVLTDLPAGRVVARIGERAAIGVGSGLGLVGVLAAILAPNLAVLAVGLLLIGSAGAVWGLARQTYLVSVVAPRQRGRAMSTLAGAHRLGFFCGPFLGAALVHGFGPVGALWLQLVTTVVAAAAMVTIRAAAPTDPSALRPLHTVVSENRTALGTLGLAAVAVGAARASRSALLPLWAVHLGIDAATTSLLFGLAGAIDVLMSYPAGVWLDRAGSRVTGVACGLCFAVGYAALPFTDSVLTMGAATMLLGLANGLSNGLIMTVGAFAAPPDRRAEFLGAWRVTHDAGMFAGPVAVGLVGALAGLSAAGGLLAVALGVGTVAMYRWFPGPLSRPGAADQDFTRKPSRTRASVTEPAATPDRGR
ncbi:MFS transporter [Nocardia caishijiensis]|uniref:MFS family arabinose efflux permease n=1 Tax=Nocardia caishijiensis TaxID=184756 RepID=A0ABQ6YGQ7_9NOCA|nr:MFS transporter [Nocardia caishijiensis]KAF0844988.1 putative MFS family arabinose efflux permease [Nocardia caishijiensis]